MSSKAKPQRSIDGENILETPAKDVMSLGYGLCPQMVFRDSRLEPGAKAIYGYLASFAGAGMTAFPSQQLMLKELNMSRPTYTKHLKQLQAYGYVKVERRKNERNEFTSNIYELVREPEIDDERMEAYSQLRKRALEASRLRRCASESQGSVEALAEIITSDKTLAAMVAAAIVDNLDAVENSPVSKNFTVEEKPSSEPVSKNFTVDSPVSSFFTNPVSKNFTVVNSVNSNKGQVTDSTYQPTLGCSQVVTGEERETAPSRGRLVGKTTDGFEKLVADSMKPVPQAKLEAVRSAYDNRRSQGYSASDIALAYEAYRASYVAEHKSLKHAKQLDRWLVDGDGLVSYAMMIEVGPQFAKSACAEAGAAIPVNESERRALSRADSEAIAEALERIDPIFQAMRAKLENAKRLCERTGSSEDWEAWRTLGDQTDAYLAANRRAATAEYLRMLRSRGKND